MHPTIYSITKKKEKRKTPVFFSSLFTNPKGQNPQKPSKSEEKGKPHFLFAQIHYNFFVFVEGKIGFSKWLELFSNQDHYSLILESGQEGSRDSFELQKIEWALGDTKGPVSCLDAHGIRANINIDPNIEKY